MRECGNAMQNYSYPHAHAETHTHKRTNAHAQTHTHKRTNAHAHAQTHTRKRTRTLNSRVQIVRHTCTQTPTRQPKERSEGCGRQHAQQHAWNLAANQHHRPLPPAPCTPCLHAHTARHSLQGCFLYKTVTLIIKSCCCLFVCEHSVHRPRPFNSNALYSLVCCLISRWHHSTKFSLDIHTVVDCTITVFAFKTTKLPTLNAQITALPATHTLLYFIVALRIEKLSKRTCFEQPC